MRSQKMGSPWHGTFEKWMREFLAARQAAVKVYYIQTLHQLQIMLSDEADHSTDVAEKIVVQETWREISAQLPATAFQFHSDYPH